MSRFFSMEKFAYLTPYTPGEQPQDRKYIKLNTNESPFPPSPGVIAAVSEEAEDLQLYSDPRSRKITEAIAAYHALSPEQILVTNGSDETLNFAFMAFCDSETPVIFPDISYGFYPVLAALHQIPSVEIPLREDLTLQVEDYFHKKGMIVIANPNAPTGLTRSPAELEQILKESPEALLVVDEAYVDFGGESMVPYVDKYDNLLVIRTFSKSFSLAGGRLGYAVGDPSLIQDLDILKYSTNPYNVNRMTSAAGCAALREAEYYRKNCRTIEENRSWTTDALRDLGFSVLDSRANFLFARSDRIPGESLYLKLKEKGILVRHFPKERIRDFVRITIGNEEQMEAMIAAVKEILA